MPAVPLGLVLVGAALRRVQRVHFEATLSCPHSLFLWTPCVLQGSPPPVASTISFATEHGVSGAGGGASYGRGSLEPCPWSLRAGMAHGDTLCRQRGQAEGQEERAGRGAGGRTGEGGALLVVVGSFSRLLSAVSVYHVRCAWSEPPSIPCPVLLLPAEQTIRAQLRRDAAPLTVQYVEVGTQPLPLLDSA